jgi:hypothetical protein
VHKNARHGENWHYHKIIIVMGNDYFFPTNFEREIGDIFDFFCFSSASLTNFSFFFKKSSKFFISQNWKQKEMERKPWSS